MKHVCLEDSAHEFDRDEQKLIILQIAKTVTELGTGIAACKFSITDLVPSLAPSLRICATSYMTEAQIKGACKDLAKAYAETLEKAVKVGVVVSMRYVSYLCVMCCIYLPACCYLVSVSRM